MIALDGQPALSPFRIDRLNAEFAGADSATRVSAARYVYFVDPLPDAALDMARLCEVIEADSGAARTATLWVVPRLGTRSPWLSKATDILVGCGFPVRRIERGIAFELDDAPPRDGDAWRRLLLALHDPMTQSVIETLADAVHVFDGGRPAPLARIALGADAAAALDAANARLGLALAADEIAYLADCYRELGRDPSDAELMMFAQANSEHCRHKVFNASFEVDGVAQAKSLFAMIRNTHQQSPAHTLSAYHDNAAVIEGNAARRFFADPADDVFRVHAEDVPYAITVETHNHPTAISPYAGAATGSGGEIRDEGATGRGGKPKAGLVGFSVSDLRIPGLPRPWESARPLPPRFASAFEIMRDGPLGGAAFNNEFGRPCLGGYFRAFEQDGAAPGLRRGYDKPIMIAGGLASVRAAHVDKRTLQDGDAVIVLGGPAMLIGLGGGAASSVAAGSSSEQLDFASVQRDNPEMQRRCQEVIDACWARGDANPIVSVHDVGAGGLSNAIPEILNDSGVGGLIELRAIPSDDPQLSPMQIWCNESQERYVLGVRPADLAEFEAICARERCPYAVVGHATTERRLVVSDARPPAPGLQSSIVIDLPLDVLFGKPPRMQRDAHRRGGRMDVVPDVDGIVLGVALERVLRLPAVGSKAFLVTIGDRTVGGLCSRDPMVGPWQVPVADCAVTISDFDGYAGEAMAMGERTPLALLDAAASARMAVGEALTNLVAAEVNLEEVRLSANWMAAVGHDGEDAALYDAVHAVGMELCPALGVSIPVGKDSLSMQVGWQDAGGDKRTVSPVSLIVSAFARTRDVRQALTPQLVLDQGDSDIWLLDLGAGRNRLGGSSLLQAFNRGGGAPPDLDDVQRFKAFFAAVQQANADGLLLACHDRSDGGALVALVEMALAGHCGLDIGLDGWGDSVLAALFSEELGALVQVRASDREAFSALLARHGIGDIAHRDSARTGRQRPGRDGGGVHPRRLRCRRRAHERPCLESAQAGRFQRIRRLWRLQLRRRARCRSRLGCIDPVQRAPARRVRRVLRRPVEVLARRLQRLPDDGEPEVDHPRRDALAALRAQFERAVRGTPGHARGARIAVDPVRRHGRITHPGGGRARRGAHAVLASSRSAPGAGGRAFRRQRRSRDRAIPAQLERFGGRQCRFHCRTGSRDDPDAASGTRRAQRATVVAAARMGRGFAVDAHVPQCACVGRLNGPVADPRVRPEGGAVVAARVRRMVLVRVAVGVAVDAACQAGPARSLGRAVRERQARR
jgi:phosphoribosylformylglycinamidine synthase